MTSSPVSSPPRRRRLPIAAVAVLMLIAAGVVADLLTSPAGDDRKPSPKPAPTPEVLSFESRPDLHPPAVEVTRRTGEAHHGYVFVGPKRGAGQSGAMILDERGGLVWFRPAPPEESVFDLRPQTYRGKPVLTWWEGKVTEGHGEGEGVIVDDSYREIARVRARGGGTTDLHELVLTPRGTALVTVYRPVRRDLRPLGGRRHAKVFDSIVQEVDVASGRVVFEWHSLRHVPLRESYEKLPKSRREPYDYFHINSIQERPNGNLVVSARHTSAVYEIDRRTGRVRWRLGGKRSDFRMGRGASFKGQHDAQFTSPSTIAIYDNGFPPAPARETRVVILRLDRTARTARLVRAYRHPDAFESLTQGSEQVMRDGNVFVGWGGNSSSFTEFTKDGRLAFDAHFVPKGTTSYRAYRLPWRARPAQKPRVAVRRTIAGATLYASWNGATGVARWRVLAGGSAGSLRRVATVPRTGFETEVPVAASGPLYAVEALGPGGAMLGRSEVERASGG